VPGVYVAPSIWRQMDVRTATAVYASIASNPTDEQVVWEPLWNDALISRSRSLMATKFLTDEHLKDCDVMVIVDDDVVWQAEDFWKIVEGCRETRSIYGGVYVTRSHSDPHISSRLFSGSAIDIRQTPERRPIELEYLATGFMAVHRDVFEKMLEGEFRDAFGVHRIVKVTKGADRPFWPFFSPFIIEDAPDSYHYLSEDWAFNERARQLGFRVWFDQSIVLQHMGLYPYTVADIGRKDSGLPSSGTDLVATRGRDRKTGQPLIDSLVGDIAEWADESEGDIRRLMATATARLFELWQTKPDDQTELEFYEREDVGLLYVLDLANWHLAGGCPVSLAGITAGETWLDYGCGIGTMALLAAKAGASVTAYEPNKVTREFAAWRAQKYGLDVTVVAGADVTNWPGMPFGGITCWHVFEHMPPPVAEGLVEAMAEWLKPGGTLISESGFHDQTTPMHHDHPDWEGVLAGAGFRQVRPAVYQLEPAAVPA